MRSRSPTTSRRPTTATNGNSSLHPNIGYFGAGPWESAYAGDLSEFLRLSPPFRSQLNSFEKESFGAGHGRTRCYNPARFRGERHAPAVSRRRLPPSRQDARIAQLVEQRIENPRVGGSNPPPGTIFRLFLPSSASTIRPKFLRVSVNMGAPLFRLQSPTLKGCRWSVACLQSRTVRALLRPATMARRRE